MKFRDTLQLVTGACAVEWMGWPGMLRTLVFHMQPMLSYTGQRGHAQSTGEKDVAHILLSSRAMNPHSSSNTSSSNNTMCPPK